ncbi:hypothetical protein [Micromonospora sp. NPDC049679]|uniref:hypothetical protein n=1 Tax=Micromonospora sp. NPDC049679 TaxID=3155920 RepID=UPI0033EBE610
MFAGFILSPESATTAHVRRVPARPRPVRELRLVAALFAAYKLGRLAIDGNVVTAVGNASAAPA